MTQQVKNPPAIKETKETWFRSLGQENALEKELATRPSILPGKSHRERSLAGYSSRDHKESDMPEQLKYICIQEILFY